MLRIKLSSISIFDINKGKHEKLIQQGIQASSNIEMRKHSDLPRVPSLALLNYTNSRQGCGALLKIRAYWK